MANLPASQVRVGDFVYSTPAELSLKGEGFDHRERWRRVNRIGLTSARGVLRFVFEDGSEREVQKTGSLMARHDAPEIMPSDEDVRFTPETMNRLASKVDKLRADGLFDIEADAADLEAEQHFLLALNALEQASRYLKLAGLKQARALAAARR